ncbi:hypothetical protein [Phaeobacter inhibens]|uniref:hypothetical protein n=1 Tax=Phaeobacter inhibens TaxID=221822 RepID=UPI000F4994B0|nr:hypothetical protein [Phaeobacter inhibens]
MTSIHPAMTIVISIRSIGLRLTAKRHFKAECAKFCMAENSQNGDARQAAGVSGADPEPSDI